MSALKKLGHRGPDSLGILQGQLSNGRKYLIGHTRLAIVGADSASQPFRYPNITVAANGEIYNYRDILDSSEFTPLTGSDCEALIPLIRQDRLDRANGQFAVVWVTDDNIHAARDSFGICPLYHCSDKHENVWLTSEFKAIPNLRTVSIIEPGSSVKLDNRTNWWSIKTFMDTVSLERSKVPVDVNVDPVKWIRGALTKSVQMRLMRDDSVKAACLLSGGLDSSIIAAIWASLSDTPIDTYSIGLADSPDLVSARKVADHIGSNHTEVIVTVDELFDAISDTIRSIETWDTTTIRASTPMRLLAQRMHADGVKMCLSGEGADELFGGYLYFAYAPSPDEFQKETVRRLMDIGDYDCLRADKSMMAFSIETRPPFLDQDFVAGVLNIKPELKWHHKNGEKCIEKRILRDAFRDMLPSCIIDRQKEAFSDGVGYNWVSHIGDKLQTPVTHEAQELMKRLECETLEELSYVTQFMQQFGIHHTQVNTQGVWRPRWTDVRDPSATFLNVHKDCR